MKQWRKGLAAFLAVIWLLNLGLPGVAAGEGRSVYAKTSASVEIGGYGYCYVYLDDLTDLAALNVMIYYDTEQVTVLNHYNQAPHELYEASNQNGCLQYSYIFSGNDTSQNVNLIYFSYRVNEDAEIGESYFDIVISDAYDTSLQVMDVQGSRCKFQITQPQTQNVCWVYGDYAVDTMVEETFFVDYYISDTQMASGSFVIQYDPELLAFVELELGGFLADKVVDVNTKLGGSVYVAFVGTESSYDSHLLRVTFRTQKNVDADAQIIFRPATFYDQNWQKYTCSGYTTNVHVGKNPDYTADAPSMRLNATYDKDSGLLTVTILLDAESHLGAGDFELTFDPEVLHFRAAQKEFTPTFFTVNDKHVDNGVLKFSIISTTDLVEELKVLTVTLDAVAACSDVATALTIRGSGLSDAMTEPIVLNFADADVTVLTKGHQDVLRDHNCDVCGAELGRCMDENGDRICDWCGAAMYKPGDMDRDGDVDSDDAIYLLYHTFKPLEYALDQPGDMDGDGDVDSDDAIYLLYHTFKPSEYPLP